MPDINNRFTGQGARELVDAISRGDDAYIAQALQLNPSAIRVQTIDLSTAPTNPVLVNFPFKSVYVASASDSSALVSMRPFSDSENNDYAPLRLKDSVGWDYSISRCFLTWTAQAGKTMTLVFFTDAKFTSGSFNTQVTSSLDGTSINDFSSVTVTADGTAKLIDSTHNVIEVFNEGPGDLWVGGSGVSAAAGAEKGYRLPAGYGKRYRNSGSLYYACLTAGTIFRYQTET